MDRFSCRGGWVSIVSVVKVALRVWLCAVLVASSTSLILPSTTEAAKWGLSVGGGAGAPALHIEHHTAAKTAVSMTVGLNRVYSGYYVQVGGKWFFGADGVGPFAHLTGTYGTGETTNAVWQTGELGLTVGNSWRFGENVRLHLEVGLAVGDAASRPKNGAAIGTPVYSQPSTRYIVGWRMLYGR